MKKEQNQVNEDLCAIAPDEVFRFACSPTVACFNECCRDLNQFLYPYDILRLKQRLNLSSGEFLKRYTTQHIGPESGLPIVTLKRADAGGLTCPFVTKGGCRVYADRPASCRTYPLLRATSKCRETGRITERFMLLNEPHCLGFNEPKEQTFSRWINDQDIAVYNHINDKLLEIINLKNQLHPGPLNLKLRQLFYTALYDLDNFRSQVFNTALLNGVDMDPQTLADAEFDDTALLKVAMEYVKQTLFKS